MGWTEVPDGGQHVVPVVIGVDIGKEVFHLVGFAADGLAVDRSIQARTFSCARSARSNLVRSSALLR
jgi:hypothetical protein